MEGSEGFNAPDTESRVPTPEVAIEPTGAEATGPAVADNVKDMAIQGPEAGLIHLANLDLSALDAKVQQNSENDNQSALPDERSAAEGQQTGSVGSVDEAIDEASPGDQADATQETEDDKDKSTQPEDEEAKTQEQRLLDAENKIAQLTTDNKQIKKELESISRAIQMLLAQQAQQEQDPGTKQLVTSLLTEIVAGITMETAKEAVHVGNQVIAQKI